MNRIILIGNGFEKKIGDKIYSNFKYRDFTESAINKSVEVEYNNLKIVYENIKDLENNLMSFYEKQIISIFKSKNPLLEIRKKLLPTKSEIIFKL